MMDIKEAWSTKTGTRRSVGSEEKIRGGVEGHDTKIKRFCKEK